MADPSIASAPAVQQLLEQLNLHLNEPEPVIICRICQFALNGSIKSSVDHVVDEHNHHKALVKDLSQLLRPYTRATWPNRLSPQSGFLAADPLARIRLLRARFNARLTKILRDCTPVAHIEMLLL
jgi:hypothetical protein